MALPQGFEGQVRGRSGLALRHGLYIPNAPGTIDADYRGEVGVILQNGGRIQYGLSEVNESLNWCSHRSSKVASCCAINSGKRPAVPAVSAVRDDDE